MDGFNAKTPRREDARKRWRYKDISVVRLFDYLRWDEKRVVVL